MSPSQRVPLPILPRSTLRLESSLLLRVARTTIQTSSPLTRVQLTLWLARSLLGQVGNCTYKILTFCPMAGTSSNHQGLGGVLAGMLLSYYLRPKFEWIDPFICGFSLLIRCLDKIVLKRSKHCFSLQHSTACFGCPAGKRQHYGRLYCYVLWHVLPKYQLVGLIQSS